MENITTICHKIQQIIVENVQCGFFTRKHKRHGRNGAFFLSLFVFDILRNFSLLLRFDSTQLESRLRSNGF